jgi:hypothetical protein
MRTTIRITVMALVLLSSAAFAGEPGHRSGKGHAVRQHHRFNERRRFPKRLGRTPHIWTGVQGIRDVINGNYLAALDRNNRMIARMARKKAELEGYRQRSRR